MYPRPPAPRRHTGWKIFGALLVMGLIIRYWWLILGLAGLGAITYGCVLWWQNRQQRITETRRHHAELTARAHYEHQLYLQGDPAGIYGRYHPHTE